MTTYIERTELFDDTDAFFDLRTGDRLLGTLNTPEDVDWVRVSLVAGQSYLMTLSGANDLGGLNRPLLTLRDETGAQIASDRGSGPDRDVVLSFEATETGIYFLDVRTSSLRGIDQGAYELTFDTLDETQDAPADVTTPFAIAPGDPFYGRISFHERDQDWIAVEMLAGETYFAAAEGFGNFDPALRLYGADGALVAQNNDYFGETDAFVSYTAATSGTYFLQAMSLVDQGAYQLRLGTRLVEGPDAPTHAATPYAVSEGETFRGTFAASEADHDIIAADVSAGTTYLVTLRTEREDFPWMRNMSLDVLDPMSNTVAVISDTHNFTAFAVYHSTGDGDVFLDAAALDPRGIDQAYTLSVITADTAAATASDDILIGTTGADRIVLGGGDDYYAGFGGNDTVFAGADDDRILGGSGFDVIWGGTGFDSLEGGDNADNLFGQAGEDSLFGGAGFDRLFGGAAADALSGGEGNDALFGQQGDDFLSGDAGDDRLFGGAGNDTLTASEGNDTLFGGAGFDQLFGMTGDNVLTGDFNADFFIFQMGETSTSNLDFGHDTITDFDASNAFERIYLFIYREQGEGEDFDLFEDHMSQMGNDVVISIDAENSITLLDVQLDDLSPSDFFIFGPF